MKCHQSSKTFTSPYSGTKTNVATAITLNISKRKCLLNPIYQDIIYHFINLRLYNFKRVIFIDTLLHISLDLVLELKRLTMKSLKIVFVIKT